MNKWQKIGIFAGVTATAAAITYVSNRLIFSASVSMGVTNIEGMQRYKWKFGDVAYIKKGTGSPILLVHDLNSISSSYEWSGVYDDLAKNHTVYAIDLIGCGYSDKPEITYTAYLYAQLLSDFIKNVIGHRTDIVITGDSAPLAIIACYSDNTLFNKIVLVNPKSPQSCSQIPGKRKNLFRTLLNAPIIGNSIYNMSVSKKAIDETCRTKLFYSSSSVTASIINAFHETAHLGGFAARHLFASAGCNYTAVSINKALGAINNSIFIIAGDHANNAKNIIREYTELNSSIESVTIPRSKHLPQLERPARFLNQLKIFL